jgi:hypothetical protein
VKLRDLVAREEDEQGAMAQKLIDADRELDDLRSERIGLIDAVREAAPVVEMFEQLLADRVLSEGGPILTQVRAWLALPAVKAATKT